MEQIKESAFFEVLEQGREEFNERFLRARHSGVRVDGEPFLEILRELVGPVVDAVAEVDGTAALGATRVLFETGLKLYAKGLLGKESRHSQVTSLWKVELPELATFLVNRPERVVSSLSNAAHNLAISLHADATAWRQLLVELAPRCKDDEELLEVGKVLAWRCGMAHYRESALEVWEGLEEGLKYAVMGVSTEVGDVDELRERLYDRWSGVVVGERSSEPQVVARVGGFLGTGGVFIEPPLVGIVDGQLFGFDRKGVFSIHADVYGACCRRAPNAIADRLHEKWLDNSLELIDEVRRLEPGFGDATSVVRAEETTALSLNHSHYIYLIA